MILYASNGHGKMANKFGKKQNLKIINVLMQSM